MTVDSIPVPILDYALKYRASSLSIIATRSDKTPVMSWRQYQDAIASEEQLGYMFMNYSLAKGLGVVCGAVSGNLECIDFDSAGEAFEPWRELVAAEDPGIFHSLVIAKSPSGGRHIIYRCPEVTIPGNQKLAMRPAPTEQQPNAQTVLIETRGEGGYFCAYPSPGYEFLQRSLADIPEITQNQRDILLRSARFLNEVVHPAEMPIRTKPALASTENHYRPGDDFNMKCDRMQMAELLTRHGWRFWRENGPNTAWTRPGKEKGISATVRTIDGVEVLYVFTSSSVFTPMRGYSPFQVYTALEHDGDHGRAAAELSRKGYGSEPDDGFDTAAFIANSHAIVEWNETEDHKIADPGPFPEHLLRVPGFIGEFSEFINRKAVKPQPVLSLAASIATMGILTGRKVEGLTGLRTNVYVLGVAESGTGKDKPREMIRQLLLKTGNDNLYASDRLKSDAGIRSALEANPCSLFLLDEIGELLETIKHAKNSPWLRNIVTELLMLYSAAQAPGVKMGGLADIKRAIVVDHPHVCLFGTSVPRSVFNSMTMNSVTGGLLGRLLIFESSAGNPMKQIPSSEDFPFSVVRDAEYWRNFLPNGNLTGNHAGSISAPFRVNESSEATAIFDDCEKKARNDLEKISFDWSGPYNRTEENARKLALIHACSENSVSPFIGVASAKWGSELALYLTRRLVFLADMNVADNETHERRNRAYNLIVQAGEKGISQTALARKLRGLKPREIGEIIDALVMAEDVIAVKIKTKTKPRVVFWENNSNNSIAAGVFSSSQPEENQPDTK